MVLVSREDEVDRYWKAVIAAAGVVVQIAAAAGAAGAVPAQWRPWVNVVVAIATAVLVYRVPNEPMDGGRHRAGSAAAAADAGLSRVLLLVPVVVLVLLAVAVPPAVAGIRHHEEHTGRRPAAAVVVDPVLLSAVPVCEGKTLISYRLDRLDGVAGFVQVDGPPPGVEAWLDGAWRPEPVTAGEAAGTLEISDRRAFRIRLVAGSGPGVPGFVQDLVHCG
jgi:hypothetical protein